MPTLKTTTQVWIRAIVYMLMVGGGWLIILPLSLLVLEQQTLSLRGMPWLMLGAIVFIIGIILGLVAGYYLIGRGRGTPFPLDPTHELVTSGPYGYVRNPQAIAMVLMVTGEIIALESHII
jgi:protein-S-isoprenylcysteine O-methyltransferase Ste14